MVNYNVIFKYSHDDLATPNTREHSTYLFELMLIVGLFV